ncbi:hypothetical protein ABD76_22780 [Paenibacillus dendritiformis]|nr:hypothetical protein [Paenibacillus dendritiformis]
MHNMTNTVATNGKIIHVIAVVERRIPAIMQDSASVRGLIEHHSCKCTSFSRQNSSLCRNAR